AFAGAIVLQPVATPAQTGPFMRFRGGGPPKTDCMLVTDVAGVPRGRVARCTDGDPTCDGDGRADGTCLFAVHVCLDAPDPGEPRCHADAVTGAQAWSPTPGFAGLVAALEGLLRVAPGDPDRSFLLWKLEGTLGPDEGQSMPRVGAQLPPTLIDLVRRWIAAGAPADASF